VTIKYVNSRTPALANGRHIEATWNNKLICSVEFVSRLIDRKKLFPKHFQWTNAHFWSVAISSKTRFMLLRNLSLGGVIDSREKIINSFALVMTCHARFRPSTCNVPLCRTKSSGISWITSGKLQRSCLITSVKKNLKNCTCRCLPQARQSTAKLRLVL